ncbi:uncharacterized protein LOC120509935 [Passer montanus]|uniref:uncharacterized protein LOC120509935 n=1 Tax=Passer montanus TaxID=9160 RepID=UPI001960055D|nr:uncharacterized protein LOC120509935 [Passer montanus]
MVCSECGDGYGEPPQPPQIPCLGTSVSFRHLSWMPLPLPCVLSPLYRVTESMISPITPIPSGPYPHTGCQPLPPASALCVSPVPVANATITLSPLAHQLRPGDPVTLRCSVQVGSAPVTFTWLHNGQELARGPFLELEDVNVGHSGTYQCVATNQLGGHQAFSPELALKVTPWGHRDTVAVNVSRTLLFLLLLLAVIGGCHWWHRRGPPWVSPGPALPQDPQETNVELSGPHEGQRDPRDNENVL